MQKATCCSAVGSTGGMQQPARLRPHTTTMTHESSQTRTETSTRAGYASPQQRLGCCSGCGEGGGGQRLLCLTAAAAAAAVAAAAVDAAAAVSADAEEDVVARAMRWVAPTQRLAPLSGSRDEQPTAERDGC